MPARRRPSTTPSASAKYSRMTSKNPSPGPATVVCNYRVKKGSEGEFEKLLARHWPTLDKLGLVTAEPSTIHRGSDETGATFYLEIFTWKDGSTPQRAHEMPEVMAVWEPMGRCTQARGGRPPMEFSSVERVKIEFAMV